MKRFPLVCTLFLAALMIVGLGAAAPAREIQANPKTLAEVLEQTEPGDTILLATGEYGAVSISKAYDKPLTVSAAKGAKPVMTGGVSVAKARGVHLAGLTFTWPAGARPSNPKATFLAITDSQDVDVSGCEFYDDPKRNEWVGWVCDIRNSQKVLVRDSKAHHIYFGFSVEAGKDVTFRNLDVGPWSHEDAIRMMNCDGPILVEGCHLTNTGVAGPKTGHLDGIQVVYWTDNLTIRNCHIHGIQQGIGAFASKERRRKNWHIEGNLIYDTFAPHVCSVYDCDGVVIVNNTFPQNQPILKGCTGGVVKNNICGVGDGAKVEGVEADYNLWTAARTKVGEHDLVGVEAKFVNAPLLVLRSDYSKNKEMTRSKFLFRGAVKGQIAVGDVVEVFNTDGSARDAKPRKVTAVGDNWLEVDKPIDRDSDTSGVFVYKWPADAKSLVPDYRLRPDSPVIDSADGSVKRKVDRDGHEPTDVPSVPNTGGGDVKYLDRGAFEFVPAAAK
jgi:hypothetical protein